MNLPEKMENEFISMLLFTSIDFDNLHASDTILHKLE